MIKKKIGLSYYDPDALLHYNNGYSIEDDNWIRFPEGDQSYQELKKRVETLRVS